MCDAEDLAHLCRFAPLADISSEFYVIEHQVFFLNYMRVKCIHCCCVSVRCG